MAAITRSLFGYYDNTILKLEDKIAEAIPFIGSVISVLYLIEGIRGRTLFDNSVEIPTPSRIQRCIRGAIGLLPGVGLALIPIDLVATVVDYVRHAFHNRQVHVPPAHGHAH